MRHAPVQLALQPVVEQGRTQHAGPARQAGRAHAASVRARPVAGRAVRLVQGRAAQQLPVRERQRRMLVGSGPRLGQQHARMRPADARAQRDGRQRQGDAPATPTPRRQGQQHGRRHLRAGPGQPPPGMRADRQVRVIAPGKGPMGHRQRLAALPGEALPQQQRQQGQCAGGQHRAATRRLAVMGIRIRLAPPQPCGGQGQCQRRARGQRQMSGAGTQQARQALCPRPAQGHQPGHPGQRPGRSPGQPRAPRPACARQGGPRPGQHGWRRRAASAIATVLTTSRPGPAAPRRDAATPPASDRPDDADTAGH